MRTAFDKALVLGVGGGAGKIVQEIARSKPGSWLELVAIDSDFKDLSFVDGVHQVPVGEDWCEGKGCGGSLTKGEHVAATVFKDLRDMMNDAGMIIIIGCLGGGTASGMLPLLTRISKEEKCPGFCLVTVPAELEGSERVRTARHAVERLQEQEDLLLVLENDMVFAHFPHETRLNDVLQTLNGLVADAVLGMASMIRSREGLPLDLEALANVLAEKPASCAFASASAQGEGAAGSVIEKVLCSPTLGQEHYLKHADFIITAVSGGQGLSLGAMRICIYDLQKKLPSSARTLCAASLLDELPDDFIRVTLIAVTFRRQKDKLDRNALDAMSFAEITMKMDLGEDNLPVSAHEVTGVLGIFGNAAPTLFNGENLDMPTFMRKGISIEQILEDVFNAE